MSPSDASHELPMRRKFTSIKLSGVRDEQRERAKTQPIKIVNYINGINKTLNAKTWFNVKTNGRQVCGKKKTR